MTIISSKEFAANQQKYFALARDRREVYIKEDDDMFMFCYANQQEEPMIFEPDDDFYRSISMDELLKRVKKDIHQWYKEKNESHSNA